MSGDQHPTRRRVTMPAPTEWPRVGKIRLGEKIDTGRISEKTGDSIVRPSAIDYFRVDPADGITSPESAASFHEEYGERPTSIRCQVPGRSAADVFEGAWRLYGARKLKQICDGETCDVRTATGGWESMPCACKAQGIPLKKPNGVANEKHCKLSYTLNLFLPDVLGVGVWQIDTGSEISVARIARWLQMMENVTGGDLLFLDFTLNLVAVDVSPDGRSKKVHVLEPRAVGATPRELLTGGGRTVVALPAGEPVESGPNLPPPAYDDEPVDPAPVDDPGPEPPPEASDEQGDDDGPIDGEVVVPTYLETLEDLRRIAPHLSDEEIGLECAKAMGRAIKAPELADAAISGRVIAYFLDEKEKRDRDGAGEAMPPGQTSFLGDETPEHRDPTAGES